MISRLVTPDLIITILVRLLGSPILLAREEELAGYERVRNTLSGWDIPKAVKILPVGGPVIGYPVL